VKRSRRRRIKNDIVLEALVLFLLDWKLDIIAMLRKCMNLIWLMFILSCT
jgi:hypothetical protein